MPSRFASLGILVYWSVAAFCLLTWEILPELSLGYPPDFRIIAMAGESAPPARWSVDVIDDPQTPEIRRSVGEAVTRSQRLPDGWFELHGRMIVNAGELLKQSPAGVRGGTRVELTSEYRVDPSGNLKSFDVTVASQETMDPLFQVKGRLRQGMMEVVAQGPLPILNQKLSFPYDARGMVHDSLAPLDRLPGLHLGQRWETRVVNPFTGQVQQVRVEVRRRTLVHWNGEPVDVLEVVHQAGPITARSWVRSDGVILRQEVPLPIVRLVLERLPDGAAAAAPSSIRGGSLP